jgi:hypothetical protein
MDKNDRFTDQAFQKVTDKKTIEEATRKATELEGSKPPVAKKEDIL